MSVQENLRRRLLEAGIAVEKIDERSFPGEQWFIVYVHESFLVAAQSMAGNLELELARGHNRDSVFVVTFRPAPLDATKALDVEKPRGRLFAAEVDQLVQLLEARSRTSDALPSLKYVEDPRASLAAVSASRHHLIYGRRGVGKTALLLEAKTSAERRGNVTAWFNAHTLRQATPENAFLSLAEGMLRSVHQRGGSTGSLAFARLVQVADELQALNAGEISTLPPKTVADVNEALRGVLRAGVLRLYVYVDDFYLYPMERQPALLDYLAGSMRDCDGWLKLASIERLTRPFEPSSRAGLEVPHDASVIDIDVTLESPAEAQHFLEAMIGNYTGTAGLRGPASIAKPEALGRLVLASGGVPRDYLNLFASSIMIARQARSLARVVGKEDVAIAAGRAARAKKRDLEQDVTATNAQDLLALLEKVSAFTKSQQYTYFLLNFRDKSHPSYETLGRLVDLRFAHLVQATLSDQHKPGVRYEAYMLDLSEFSDVRLQRGLNVLDIVNGTWAWRLTGQRRTIKELSGTGLRDRLRQAPVVDLASLSTGRA